jgi:hypothetical protein
MEVFFHLFYDMFCLEVMFNFQVGRRFDHFMGVPTDWTELPFLETIHIREGPAGRAPDYEVHDKEVMRVILIKIYRLIVIIIRKGVFIKMTPVSCKKRNVKSLKEGMRNTTPLSSDHLIELLLWSKFRS